MTITTIATVAPDESDGEDGEPVSVPSQAFGTNPNVVFLVLTKVPEAYTALMASLEMSI
jgi:hypothetical protein